MDAKAIENFILGKKIELKELEIQAEITLKDYEVKRTTLKSQIGMFETQLLVLQSK